MSKSSVSTVMAALAAGLAGCGAPAVRSAPDPHTTTTTFTEDAGATATNDAGATAIRDAGTTPDDAGDESSDDAGLALLDAGTPSAGDAGLVTVDDAGLPSSDAGISVPPATTWWQPAVHTTWDWQLAIPVNVTSASVNVYDIDMFENDPSVMAQLHALGRKVICYVDVGSWEDWRPDASDFPASVIGAPYSGFPDENWLDIRQLDVLGPIMEARFTMALSKGCDGVEPDNMDGYDTTAHESSGFPLTYQDQLTYDRWVATHVHALGMAAGLKNDINQTVDLVGSVDFAVSEQAFEYDEFSDFTIFIQSGKPVFEAEYNLPTTAFCPQAIDLEFSAILKDTSLDSFRESCW